MINIDLPNNRSGNVTGHICVIHSYYDHTILPVVYTGGILLLTIIQVIVISILYVVKGRKIFAHIKFREKFKRYNSEGMDKSDKRRYSEQGESSRKITKIAFIIVVVFIISYIPTTIDKIVDTVSLHHQLESDSSNSNIASIVVRTSYCLNHAVNFVVYVLFDHKFRLDVKSIFRTLFHFRKTSH